MTGPDGPGASWRAARPSGPDAALSAWFSLTPRNPCIDSRIGGSDVELSATLATFGGITGPGTANATDGSPAPPSVILGGNAVAPGSPAGPVADRTRQCAVRLRVAAEGLNAGRQCLVLATLCALGRGDHHVQSLLGEVALFECPIAGQDRIAVLFDVPHDGRLLVELWLRLAAKDSSAQLGVHGIAGHLL